MSYRTSYLLTALFATYAIVPALATDITPIRCPESCPGLLVEVRIINQSPGNQLNPRVSGDLMTYTDVDRISYYFFSTGQTGQIPAPQDSVDSWSSVSGSKIAFTHTEVTDWTVHTPLLVYDTSNGTTTEVAREALEPAGAIGGSTVAFLDQQYTLGRLFVTDLSGSQPVTTRLTPTDRWEKPYFPGISPDGSLVVWSSCVNNTAETCDIRMASRDQPGSWTTTSLVALETTPGYGDLNTPQVDGQWVVYSAVDISGERDLYIRSLDGTTQLRLLMPGQQAFPRISAGVVIFSSMPSGVGFNTGEEFDLYLFQISTGRLWRVTDTGFNEFLSDISLVPEGGSFNIVFDQGDLLSSTLNVYGARITLPSAVTPASLLQQLIDLVGSYNLKQGISNSLDTKLQDAQAALDAARNNNIGTACNLVTSFMNEVSAQSGKSITTAQAQALLNLAIQIKQSLGCA